MFLVPKSCNPSKDLSHEPPRNKDALVQVIMDDLPLEKCKTPVVRGNLGWQQTSGDLFGFLV